MLSDKNDELLMENIGSLLSMWHLDAVAVYFLGDGNFAGETGETLDCNFTYL